jgi:hypothetical protein
MTQPPPFDFKRSRPPYFPFRAKVVKSFERPLASTVPTLSFRWSNVGLALTCLVAVIAAVVWLHPG